ncbi:MAG: ribonucleoside-triphosphate reductase [Candidatus Zambryskibacteria bacterium RIFCSPLOWO2_01_FULL_39_39]|uniref:Ribonucleoside-triphosphate reductase n=1 Tax=Candidatus Zambryskibacteria bacterium RIFCSPLOWO2_01_FULL_39_39 TaxID=1802758 RepID=A0A1G2TZH9_9BACT|nr:MAG: Ribonucleoside-triphosphate reductase [Parcubacteria group bacterium GW2011_GWA1_38_7]OHA87184.1 MAG: ribonucleoside-triphosphate reductase [Candidatus Zambryskibacteria bacterium RIFCSPHIGHO2_01_FULL_39_63]OHA94822.1 MAG: ribonucleoside-triphosphate reductase [Candidatus Zambryskibacteria bacterium RIFCSPHIGHO2_02_FULL_39_19]OHA98312.1 MAG: ribonucleoside-triphosphate reductase [Candidatus Zambryskibacteria bacterium RIFCSPHIGHO2_12_FULL_39_21]OHB02698.1 MAG: ribonucleoside-triphosphat
MPQKIKKVSKKSAMEDFVKKIQKRDGSIATFDFERIVVATNKAMRAAEEGSLPEARMVANKVLADLVRISKKYKNFVPTVEGIQDSVEKELMMSEYVATAKAFILYRDERTKVREQNIAIPQEVKNKIAESSKYFKSSYQEFIFYQFYSRWRSELGRRETWIEAVDRFIDYMKENMGSKLTPLEYSEVREAILKQDVCPSMRLLWSSGNACRQSNVTAYNCAYIAPVSWRDLSEIMYVSMRGAGCGFSVEPENVGKFPQIQKQTGKFAPKIVVEDSSEGWCKAFVSACEAWEEGCDVEFDYSLIRPAGAKLTSMGGRASGPAPLQELMQFTKRKILARQGRRLTTLDLHDIICQIGLIVVAGGVRRSALISLSALDDREMRDAKNGAFWQTNGQRSMANNSAVYESKPSAEEFLEEWTALVTSHAGERGIFNRAGLQAQVPARRWENLKDARQPGMNPCGEIYLQSKQFCNLTSIVVRPKDDMENLKNKMRIATLLGTYQATLTNFPYLSKEWKINCEKEQLLGVSITGYYDNKIIRNDENLRILRDEAIKVNKKYAKRLGVNESTAITCVKPHGNSGQLLGVGSGMHTWYSHYYIRRVRISANDPLLQLARDQGVPVKPEVGYSTSNASTMVLEFPCKAPEGAMVNKDVTALELLEEWKRLKVNFTEHNPSATIYVGDGDWIAVADFVYKNWDIVGGLSFLPRNNHVYQLAPYEEITKDEYERRLKMLGHIDFSKLLLYEKSDQTIGAKEAACVGGVCEIDYVPSMTETKTS